MSRRKNSQRRIVRRHLFLEQLEGRAMLAGNVSVDVTGGNLIVRGDNRNNQVAILQLDDGTYAVSGFNGTTVEGSADPFIAEGVTGNIDVDMKKGNDLIGIGNDVAGSIALAQAFGFGGDLGDPVALQADLEALLADAGAPAQAELPRNLFVRTGDGRDGVGVSADVNGGVHVNLGSGNNTLAVVNSEIDGVLILNSGNGQDDLFVQNVAIDGTLAAHLGNGLNIVEVLDSSIGRSAVVTTGNNVDIIDFADSAIDDNLIVRTGSGNDEVYAHAHQGNGMDIGGIIDIDTASHADYVELEGIVDGNVNIRTGNHNDEVVLNILDVHRNLIVILGSGNDVLTATGVEVDGNATIDAGAGDDDVSLSASNVDKLFVAVMGSGRDRLEILGSTAKRAILNGGSGFDALDVDDEDFADDVTVVLFEDINVIVPGP